MLLLAYARFAASTAAWICAAMAAPAAAAVSLLYTTITSTSAPESLAGASSACERGSGGAIRPSPGG